MKKFCSYLRADLRRLLCSVKMILSVALTVVMLILATLEGIDFHAGVLYVFSLVMYGMPEMVVLICGAVAFADSLCEDAEHNYIRQQIIRGRVGIYVSRRLIVVCVSIHDTALLYKFGKTICGGSRLSGCAVDTAFYGAECILSICLWDFGSLFLFQCAVSAKV